MEKIRKTKIIHYKRAEFKSDVDTTLATYLSSALRHLSKPAQRQQSLSDDTSNENTRRRVINSFKVESKIIFGQMIEYEQGLGQTIVVIDQNSDEYPVEAIALAQKDDGKTREVVASVLYFMVHDNQVLLVQSVALQSRHIEQHIGWLLKETKAIEEDVQFFLNDRPSKAAVKKINQQNVKKVSIGGNLMSSQARGQQDTTKHINYVLNDVKVKEGILRNFLTAVGQSKLIDAIDTANLRVSLEISCPARTPQQSQEIMNNIANAMRHNEPEDVKLTLQDGSTIKGKEIKITSSISVDTFNGIANANDLYQEMKTWLHNQFERGILE